MTRWSISPLRRFYFNNERIALYDENPGSRLAIAQQLKQLDAHYDEFEHLDDFTSSIHNKITEKTPYHVAIMSLSFSQEGDPIIPITIENIEKTLNCRIIVINHGLTQTSFQVLLNKSASAVLHKPVRFMHTLTTLQNLLKRSPSISLEQSRSKPPLFKVPPKILAVDDTPSNLQLLCIFLSQLGTNVTPCHSGKEALALIRDNKFDLVFMDYRMPELNGPETTKIIRKQEQNKHLPIIGLTAHAMPEEKRLIIEAGMNDCITKPIDEKQLLNIITKWTGHCPDTHIDAKAPVLPAPQSTVDLSESVRLAGGKQPLARDMFEKLIYSIKKDRKNILSEKDNAEQLLEIVHSLHGASRYCGVPSLCNQAQTTEILLNTTPRCQEQIDLEVRLLIDEIDKVIDWSVNNDFLGFQTTAGSTTLP